MTLTGTGLLVPCPRYLSVRAQPAFFACVCLKNKGSLEIRMCEHWCLRESMLQRVKSILLLTSQSPDFPVSFVRGRAISENPFMNFRCYLIRIRSSRKPDISETVFLVHRSDT